ncbi:MAG: hypothetical protein EXR65_00315 [Dehalococcoidia bacterium]|nr:hypothetical protein [Dehalococcoidia bacterium]
MVTINGVAISWDATVDSLNNVISRINQSATGVTATYDEQNDKFVITSNKTGSVAVGLADTAGNLLTSLGVLAATQGIGTGASYKINGGPLQYAATNEVTNAVTGVTLSLKEVTAAAIKVTINADTSTLKARLVDFVEEPR